MMCLHHNASIQQNMNGICKLPKSWHGRALTAKQVELVKALFGCMPAFPLSHACIVTDKLQQIPLWVGEIQRANMQPLVYGRIYLQPQALESHFLRFEIFKRYIERNVMERRPL